MRTPFPRREAGSLITDGDGSPTAAFRTSSVAFYYTARLKESVAKVEERRKAMQAAAKSDR